MCGQFQDSESSMKVDESANIRKWIASHDSREREGMRWKQRSLVR